MSETWPDIRDLVPHSGPMLLIARVLRHDEHETVCAVDTSHVLFRDREGGVPSWLGLEYMAQCIAARGCLAGRLQKGTLQAGVLASARSLRFHCARFRAGQELEAAVRPISEGRGAMSSFACLLRESGTGSILAEGQVNCVALPGSES